MPFASFNNSGFQAPQPPDWTRFAEKSIDLIQRGGEMRMAAGQHLAASVDKAVEQINGILKQASPEERMKRDIQREQLGYMREVYKDWKANPSKYQMTAHGPVLIDPYARAERLARMGHTIASTRYLNRKAGAGSGTGAFISEYMRRLQAAQKYEQAGGNLAPSKGKTLTVTPPASAAGAQQEAADTEDAAAEAEALTPPENPEGVNIAPTPFFSNDQ